MPRCRLRSQLLTLNSQLRCPCRSLTCQSIFGRARATICFHRQTPETARQTGRLDADQVAGREDRSWAMYWWHRPLACVCIPQARGLCHWGMCWWRDALRPAEAGESAAGEPAARAATEHPRVKQKNNPKLVAAARELARSMAGTRECGARRGVHGEIRTRTADAADRSGADRPAAADRGVGRFSIRCRNTCRTQTGAASAAAHPPRSRACI